MYCDHCGVRLEPSATGCPRCATPVAPPRSEDQRPVTNARPQRIGTWFRVRRPGLRTPRWFTAAIQRNFWGNLVGLFAAWFNLPFLVLMAGVGAVFGCLSGLFAGTAVGPGMLSRVDVLMNFVMPLPVRAEDLLPTAAFQIGGIVGALIGLVHGGVTVAWDTWVSFWTLLYEGDPSWPVAVAAGQVLTAVFVGYLYTFYSVAGEGARLAAAGARRPSRRETQWLVPIMSEAARRLGSPTIPILRIDDSHEPNATAGIRHIVVNRGLLDYLRYDEEAVAGVLAHELAHWHNGDPVAMAWGRGVTLPLYLAFNLAVRILGAVRWGPLRILVWALLWSVHITVERIVLPLQAAEWRRCEYRADDAAMAAGYGDGLYRALTQLQQTFDGARSGWDAAILGTHPPTELRLERLERPGRHYPLPHGLSGSRPIPPVTVTRNGPDKD